MCERNIINVISHRSVENFPSFILHVKRVQWEPVGTSTIAAAQYNVWSLFWFVEFFPF